MNMYDLIIGLFLKLVELSQTFFSFLFFEIDILGLKISLWAILGGVSFSVLFIAWLIKKLVPAA